MTTVEEQRRYLHDVVFHRLVDTLAHVLAEFRLAPEDVQSALRVAVALNEQRRERRLLVDLPKALADMGDLDARKEMLRRPVTRWVDTDKEWP